MMMMMMTYGRYLIENGALLDATNNDNELPFDLADGEEMQSLLTEYMNKLGRNCSLLMLFFFVHVPGFVQTLESPEIKMLRFPGLESPGKRHTSWKTLQKSCNSKVVVLKILLSFSCIAS